MKVNNLFIRAKEIPTKERGVYKVECKITPIIGHIYLFCLWLKARIIKNERKNGETE